MHTWGDEDFDWAGLNDAIEFIATRLKRWRVPVRDFKEKYGTARIYLSLGWSTPYDFTHPGHAWTAAARDAFYAHRAHRRFVNKLKGMRGVTWGMWTLEAEPACYVEKEK